MIKTEDEAVQVLENLNKTLIDLEKPVDINIFDAVGMAKQEIKHSAFLSWLFDSKQSHNKGGLFLLGFLKTLYQYSSEDNTVNSNSDILLNSLTLDDLMDFASAKDIVVETEKIIDKPESRIDIFIQSKEKNIVLVIENKVFSSTHDDQLRRYEEEVEKLDKEHSIKKIFVYLSPFGEKPTDIEGNYQKGWCIIDYSSIINNLRCVVKNLNNPKLKYLIGDYIDMVDNKILHNNPTIRALCKKIRREHSEALEILLNYIDNVDMVYKHIATEWLPHFQPDNAKLIYSGRKLVFCPNSVRDYYLKNGINIELDDSLFRFQVSVGSKDGPVTIVMWLSKKVDDDWTTVDRKLHNIFQPKKAMGSKYCTLYSRTLLSVEERERIFEDDKELIQLIDSRLAEFLTKLRDLEKQLES